VPITAYLHAGVLSFQRLIEVIVRCSSAFLMTQLSHQHGDFGPYAALAILLPKRNFRCDMNSPL